MLTTVFKTIFSISCIFIFLWVGKTIQITTAIPLPASIIGMLMLFFCLSVGILPSRFMQDGARLMLKHMLLFFIPIAVGLMDYFEVLYQELGLILACTIVANICVAVLLSLLFKRFNLKVN
ncbi:CidA/LrgA family protein [Aliiglaciecola lipolytica]|nr:CidA/LrgA family protein [Aliiglaciecola lipolytica]